MTRREAKLLLEAYRQDLVEHYPNWTTQEIKYHQARYFLQWLIDGSFADEKNSWTP